MKPRENLFGGRVCPHVTWAMSQLVKGKGSFFVDL